MNTFEPAALYFMLDNHEIPYIYSDNESENNLSKLLTGVIH